VTIIKFQEQNYYEFWRQKYSKNTKIVLH